MSSVVHHKDTVCLRGGQLSGEDINREQKKGWERGGGLEEVGKALTEDMEEAAFNIIYFIIFNEHKLEVVYCTSSRNAPLYPF